jgi:hypothetical protein
MGSTTELKSSRSRSSKRIPGLAIATASIPAVLLGGLATGTNAPLREDTAQVSTVAMVEPLAPEGHCLFGHHGGKDSGCHGGSFWPGTSPAWKSTPAPLPASCAHYQMPDGPPSASIPPEAQPQLYCQPGVTRPPISEGCLLGAGATAGGIILAPPTGGASLGAAALGAVATGNACH